MAMPTSGPVHDHTEPAQTEQIQSASFTTPLGQVLGKYYPNGMKVNPTQGRMHEFYECSSF